MFRNVGHKLAINTLSYPRRRQSFTLDVMQCNSDLTNLLLSEMTDVLQKAVQRLCQVQCLFCVLTLNLRTCSVLLTYSMLQPAK